MEILRTTRDTACYLLNSANDTCDSIKNFTLATVYFLEYLCTDLIPRIVAVVKDTFIQLAVGLPVIGFLLTCPGVTVGTFAFSWMRPKEVSESITSLFKTAKVWWVPMTIGLPIAAYLAGMFALPVVAIVYCAAVGSHMAMKANFPVPVRKK